MAVHEPLPERLREAALRLPAWHAAGTLAAALGALLALCAAMRWSAVGSGHRILGAGIIAIVLVAAGAGALRMAGGMQGRGGAFGASVWSAALALTSSVAALGLAAVALLILYPPPVEASAFKQWDYHDKRWLVALFLLASGLVYLPALFARLLGSAALRAPAAPVRRTWLRAPLSLAAGVALALLYVAPMLPGTTTRYLDAHEQVHLGGFQRISQGATPYLEARTQYGPGLQIVSYHMMRQSEFSLRGFRLSQAWLNVAATALLFAVFLFAYGAGLGTVVIVASLALSPLLIVTFWGWGWLLRWLAPVLVGTLAPLLLWRTVRPGARTAAVAALALACGGLAWLAQENLTGAALAMALLLAAAVVRGVTPLRTAIGLGALFVGAECAALVALLLWSFGIDRLREAWSLYTLSAGLVFQGVTNTPWSEPGSTWRRAYRATPLVVIAITAAALYLARRCGNAEDEARRGQLLGMAAAAVPLTMLTLMRADVPHFIATSTALAPLLVLAVVILPGRFRPGVNAGNLARTALAALFVLVYFNPFANYRTRIENDRTFADPRRLAHPGQMLAGLRLLEAFCPGAAQPAAAATSDATTRQLGFGFNPVAPCCHNNGWSYGEWADTLRRIHADTAGRPTFVDVNMPIETSGLYFLADLNVATPYVSRIMSIWTDDDLRTVATSLARKPPACVVSGEGALFTAGIVHRFRNAGVDRLPGPAGLTVICEQREPSGPANRHG